MKTIFSIIAVLLPNADALAGQDCRDLAITVSKQLYAFSADPVATTIVTAENNPNNTSNGFSIIVTINDSVRYLVALTPDGTGPNSFCSSVQYVIQYPWANLIKQ